MLHITGTLESVGEKEIVIKQTNGYKQTITFEKGKVVNKDGLEKILSTKVGTDIVVGVMIFVVAYMKEGKAKGFAKYVLTGDIVE